MHAIEQIFVDSLFNVVLIKSKLLQHVMVLGNRSYFVENSISN